MNTVTFTDEQLATARQAVMAFLHDFGHDEAETIRLIRAVLVQLEAAQPV